MRHNEKKQKTKGARNALGMPMAYQDRLLKALAAALEGPFNYHWMRMESASWNPKRWYHWHCGYTNAWTCKEGHHGGIGPQLFVAHSYGEPDCMNTNCAIHFPRSK